MVGGFEGEAVAEGRRHLVAAERREHALGCRAGAGGDFGDSRHRETVLHREGDDALQRDVRIHHGEDAAWREQCRRLAYQCGGRERGGAARGGTVGVGRGGAGEERRIGHYQVVARLYVGGGEVGLPHCNALAPRRLSHVVARLSHGIGVDVDGIDDGLWAALGYHQGYQSAARADVEHTRGLSLARRERSPRAEQHAIGAHLHRRAVVKHGKLLKSERLLSHWAAIAAALLCFSAAAVQIYSLSASEPNQMHAAHFAHDAHLRLQVGDVTLTGHCALLITDFSVLTLNAETNAVSWLVSIIFF